MNEFFKNVWITIKMLSLVSLACIPIAVFTDIMINYNMIIGILLEASYVIFGLATIMTIDD